MRFVEALLTPLLLLASIGCVRRTAVGRSPADLSRQIVSSTLLVDITDVEKTRIVDSPSIVAPNRSARSSVVRVISGNWSGGNDLAIAFDSSSIELSPGRYLLLADGQGQWLNLLRLEPDGRILANGKRLSPEDASLELAGRPTPWP